MRAANHPTLVPPRSGTLSGWAARPPLATLAGVAALGLLGLVLAEAIQRVPPPPLAILVPGGIAILAVLALAIARYEAAVALGILLIGAVKWEPAPTDVVFAIVIAVAAVTGRLDLGRVPMVVLGSLGAFLALNLLSTIEAIEPTRAGIYLAITLYLAAFSIWLAGFVSNGRRARLVALCYLAVAVASTVVGVLALFFWAGNPLLIYQGTRVEALFADANVYGPFLVPAILILLEEVIRPRLLRTRLSFRVAMLVILCLGVLFSYSRAAWLNLGIGLVVVLAVVLMRRGGAARAPLIIGLVAAAALAAAFVISLTGTGDFLAERAQTRQHYDVERFAAQREGLELAAAHPAGIGPGQFEIQVQLSAHSTPIRVLTEQGVLGLASFAVLALATLAMAIRNAVVGRSTYGIGSAALLGAWCGLLVNSLFVDTLHWRHLWLVAALIWAGSMTASVRSGPRGGERWPRYSSPPAAGTAVTTGSGRSPR